MERKILAYMTIIGILIAFLLTGCAVRGYGKIRLQDRNSPAATIRDLEQSWRDYRIYYAGLSVGNPAAIMFDPKNDNRTLVGDKWIEVEDQETVSELIGWIQTERQFIHGSGEYWGLITNSMAIYSMR